MPLDRTPKLAALAALVASLSTSAARGDEPGKSELNRDNDDPEKEGIDVTVRGSALSAFVSKTSVDQSAREAIDAASLVAELPSVHLAGTTVDTEGTRILPARILHSAGASVDIPFVRGLRASIEVQNLFHLRTLYVTSPLRNAPVATPVSDFLGFPLPGRTAWVSLHYVAARGGE